MARVEVEVEVEVDAYQNIEDSWVSSRRAKNDLLTLQKTKEQVVGAPARR